jgi:hypothetical protein
VAFSPKELKAKAVFILVDDENRKIFIWIGKGSAVKIRFISSTAATEIRRLYGLTYRVQTVDQGEESSEFLECIKSIPKKGLVPELADDRPDSMTATVKKSSTSRKKTTAKTKQAKSPTKKARTTKSKTTTSRKTPGRKTPARKTPARKTPTTQKTTKTQKITPKAFSSKDITPSGNYVSQDTSIITTPPCPECGAGHLLPYSKKMEQEGSEDLILPFAKWFCSKCDFSPTHK